MRRSFPTRAPFPHHRRRARKGMGTRQFKGATTFGLFITFAVLVAVHKERVDVGLEFLGPATADGAGACTLPAAYGLTSGVTVRVVAPGDDAVTAAISEPGVRAGDLCRLSVTMPGVLVANGLYRVQVPDSSWTFGDEDLRVDQIIEITLLPR